MGINNKGPNIIKQEQHSNSAKSLRDVEYGFVIGTNLGDKATGVHDDVSSATFIGENRHVLCSNRNAAFQYVTFGGAAVAAASSSNGVAIPPDGQVRLCSGENDYIRSSHADVHVVEIEN